MRRLNSPSVVLLLWCAAALPFTASAQSSAACDDEGATCRDTCNIEFGSSVTKQVQLRRCLQTCQDTHRRCSERWRELRSAGITPDPARSTLEPEYQPPPAAPQPYAEPVPYAEPSPTRPVTDDADDIGDSDNSGRTRFVAPEATPSPAAEESLRPTAPPPSRVIDADYNEGISLPSDEALGLTPEDDARPAKKKEEPVVEKAPPPAKKKASHPELPPEPEYDISDWDPGD